MLEKHEYGRNPHYDKIWSFLKFVPAGHILLITQKRPEDGLK
jgi:hypothetical protein